jgi:hypothetical protein
MYDSRQVLNYFDRMDTKGMRLSEVVEDISDAIGGDKRLIEQTLILEREDYVVVLREEKKKEEETDDVEPDKIFAEEKIEESMESGPISGFVPENARNLQEDREPLETTEIVYGGDARVVDNNTKSIKERIAEERRALNRLREATETVAKEDVDEPEVPDPVRYKMQRFNNGGQKYDPDTNTVTFGDSDGPSEYEEKRREKIDAGRKHRLEQEEADALRGHSSTYERQMNRKNTLDGQVDDFLADYIEKYGDIN